MRPVVKTGSPACLSDWIAAQIEAGASIDYYSFTNGKELKEYLLTEQFGLCAYTGRAVQTWQTTIEHIKPYSICRNELNASLQTVGDDVAYENLLATHKAYIDKPLKPPYGDYPDNLYGEAVRGDWYDTDYISPLEPDCHTHFSFDLNGHIASETVRGTAMIRNLRLNHPRLTEDRGAAIDEAVIQFASFLDFGGSIRDFIDLISTPVSNRLPSFIFAIDSALLKFE